jgi:hypothetical protein
MVGERTRGRGGQERMHFQSFALLVNLAYTVTVLNVKQERLKASRKVRMGLVIQVSHEKGANGQ